MAGVMFHTDQGGEYTGELFAAGLPRTPASPSRWAAPVGAG